MPKLTELKERGAAASKRLVDLPSEFNATLTREDIRKDRMNKECLYWEITLEDGSIVRQKYSPMHISELVGYLEKLKVTSTEELHGKKLHFKQFTSRIGNPRWYPIEVIKIPTRVPPTTTEEEPQPPQEEEA